MIYVMIVIYNQKCETSPSMRFFLKHRDGLNLVVYDNSTKDFGNQEFCAKEKIQYKGTGENRGLAKAYNEVIKNIAKTKNNYIIIADDDTEFTEKYLEEVKQLADGETEIALPIVKSGERIISPCNVEKCGRVKSVSGREELNLGKITGINSGMMVQAQVYEKNHYNEKMFLDYIDHEFMYQARAKQIKVRIMKSEISQHFSRDEKPAYEAEMRRFQIFARDFAVYCRECGTRWFYQMSMLKYRLKECMKYRRLDFLRKRSKND